MKPTLPHAVGRRQAHRHLCSVSTLASLAALAALAAPVVAYAQEEEEEAGETIVVTGTRIPKPDYAFSNPVVSIDARSIEYSGITNVTDLMQQIPALVNSQDSNDSAGSNAFIGGTGLNLLDLRNLGTERTLVLVNGRRHVAGLAGSASVDTNTIPVDLIKRVEVLTGGASAVYGADGVSGVVNFILADDFEGMRARGQLGDTEAGGGESRFLSATVGSNFDRGRGNLTLSVDYNFDGRLEATDRAYASSNEVRFARPPFDSEYDRLPFGDLRWFESGRGGAVDANFDFVADYEGGTDLPWDPGNYPDGLQSFTYAQGGSATPVGGYSGDLLPEIKRFDFNVLAHYDLTPSVRAFTEMKYSATQSLSYSQPTFDYFLAIDPDNFYLQQHPDFIAAAVGNDAPFYGLSDGSIMITRDNFDFGIRGEDIDRETLRGVWGLDGSLGAWGQWHASYTYGQTEIDNLQLNNRYNDRFAAAIDAVDDGSGNPVCRSDLDPDAVATNVFWQEWAEPTSFTPGPGSGCVPINLFGEGSPSAAAIDWIMVDSLARSKITQHVATAYFAGTLDPLFKLPAGSVGYSVGAEWRRETSRSDPALEDQLGLTFGNQLAPERGAFEVKEAFVELSIPLLQDAPLAETLSIDMAERYSSYSTIGETSTWKVGGVWAPVADIRFRATRAQAVRAPNIGELFDPGGQDFQFIDDPCDIDRLDLGTEFRAANCAALLTAAGADPDSFTDINLGISVPGVLKGNPALQEEQATTNTLGVVVRPRFISGLTFSIDYYDIELTDAINSLDPQDIADQCVDLPTTDNEFCDLITREIGGPDAGGIVEFVRQPVNVASYRTKGYDFSASYILDPRDFGAQSDWGLFSMRLIGNYLDELTYVNVPGADPDPDKGESGAPEWQASFDLAWERGPWVINYGYNYYSETQRYATSSATARRLTTLPQYAMFSARSEHDLQVRFSPTETWTLYAGVDNIGDQQPDYGQVAYPVSPKGRAFYVGFTSRLGTPGL